MSQTVLKGLIPAFGTVVLSSYAWGVTRKDISREQLWGPLTGRLKAYWAVSALLTAASYLFLWWLWAFDTELSGTDEVLLLVFQAVFLLSASLWMFLTVQHLRGRLPRWPITASLWTTAAASCGLMALSQRLPLAAPEWKRHIAVASGTMLVVQHVFWDAIVWNEGFLY